MTFIFVTGTHFCNESMVAFGNGDLNSYARAKELWVRRNSWGVCLNRILDLEAQGEREIVFLEWIGELEKILNYW
jgi:hypothetical protein